MTMKDLLVHLGNSPQGEARLEVASRLAGRYSAHLTGLYVVDLPSPAIFYGDPSGFVDAAMIDQMMARMRENARRDAAGNREKFLDRLRRDGIEGEWRMVEGISAEIVALHARYADLAIVGQATHEDETIGTGEIAPAALLSSGRPVLVLPFVGRFPNVGETVLVAWKPCREAARAVNDAIPLLRAARSVTVLAINAESGIAGEGNVPAADIAHHLARHGVKAQAAHTVSGEVSEADALLNYAAEIDADLIVAGGYGHSRVREYIFGGVTRTLLQSMTAPVFFSH